MTPELGQHGTRMPEHPGPTQNVNDCSGSEFR
jgi:hypothetical protein